MNQKFERLSDKEKLIDLLDDQLALKKYAQYIAYRTSKSIEKIESITLKEQE
jgi:hypothetical protein